MNGVQGTLLLKEMEQTTFCPFSTLFILNQGPLGEFFGTLELQSFLRVLSPHAQKKNVISHFRIVQKVREISVLSSARRTTTEQSTDKNTSGCRIYQVRLFLESLMVATLSNELS